MAKLKTKPTNRFGIEARDLAPGELAFTEDNSLIVGSFADHGPTNVQSGGPCAPYVKVKPLSSGAEVTLVQN